MKNKFSQQVFEKYTNIMGAELLHADMMKLIDAFRSFPCTLRNEFTWEF